MSRRPWRPWLPALLWAAVLFGLSAVPGNRYPEIGVWNFDKLVHAGVYAVLGAALCRALRLSPRLSRGRALAVATVLAAVYGVSDELHQAFVPLRSPDWRDATADAVGGLGGAAIWLRFEGRWPAWIAGTKGQGASAS